MSKPLTEAKLTTRAARSRLLVGVHWDRIDPDVHLGYRKGRRGGVWLVRWRNGVGYLQAPIGTADDELKEGTRDYEAARQAARKRVEEHRAEAKAAAAGTILTVRSIVEGYTAARDARESRRKGRTVRSDASQRMGKHVLSARLAEVAIHALKEADLSAWRDGLPASMKATSKHRLTNDLRAALNAAFAAHRENLPATLPAIIKFGLTSEHTEDDDEVPIARENQILNDGQVGALLKAASEIDEEQGWDGDLYRLVLLLAATGSRFSQVTRLRVGDVQRSLDRILMPTSRKGRGGGKLASTPMPIGRDVLDTLLPVTTGRAAGEWLLLRWRMKQFPGSIRWEKASRGPWKTASEMVGPWHAIRARAGLPGVIPYALRHSSIVRGLRSNLPVGLVASIHDTSAAMIQKHYAKWITSGLEDMARGAIIPLVPTNEESKVVMLRGPA